MGASISYTLKEALNKSIDLICIKCSEYLTCPPIILHIGQGNSCGRCCTDKDIKPGVSVRNNAFEALAKLQQLPCRYKDCYYSFEFDNVLSHEQYCTYILYKCVDLSGTCNWVGRRNKLKEHYAKTHAESLCSRETALSLNLRIDFEQHIFIDELNKPFLLYVRYKIISNKLKCILFYFEELGAGKKYSYEVSIKTKLTEDKPNNTTKEFLVTSDKYLY